MFEIQFSKEFRKKKLVIHANEDIEPHEVLLDRLAKKKEEEFGISETKLEVPLIRKVLLGFLFFSFILIATLFARVFQLQVIEGKNFSELSQDNKYLFHQIEAERGVIYDSNLKQLVFNERSFDLMVEKSLLLQPEAENDKILKEVANIISKDFAELKTEIENSQSQEILVLENIPHQTLIILETKLDKLPGFKIVEKPTRKYADDDIFSHLLGYIGKIKGDELKAEPDFYSIDDYVGRDGIEKSYENNLRKIPGKIQLERDAYGNIISRDIISLPQSGNSLVLYLDSELQKTITENLEEQLAIIGTKKAAAVALDPQTGGVLALVSIPSFDGNLFSGKDEKALEQLFQDSDNPLFNRAIAGKYLTGSAIKPLIASAALEEGIISPYKKINDYQGKIVVQDVLNPEKVWEYKDWTIHGLTDMRKAIAESCNVYFYTVGGGYEDQEGLGPTRIKKYLQLFGWDEKTGIDLPGESAGFIPDKDWKKRVLGEGWWDGDTYNLSIGQGYLQVTPLEVATAFASIANGGVLYQPQVVQKIIDSDKNTVEEIQPKVVRENFIDPENLQIVREGMRWAVTGQNSPQASAVLLNTLPVTAAAKTGTAQVSRKGCNDCYQIWINVFAPYENPKIVLTILLEDVEGLPSYQVVVPLAKEILNWYFMRQ